MLIVSAEGNTTRGGEEKERVGDQCLTVVELPPAPHRLLQLASKMHIQSYEKETQDSSFLKQSFARGRRPPAVPGIDNSVAQEEFWYS